jgi:NAD-dependent dihydropyrimidine dehydrogenase PreA subunit
VLDRRDFPTPTFDLARCNASARCVAVCPTECLEIWNDLPWLARPGDCLSCGACVVVCPVNAVSLDGVKAGNSQT